MADRIVKPDTGNDLVLQNDDASAKIEINEDGSMPVTGTLEGSMTVGSGKTLDVSSGTFTTSSAQKQAIVQAGPGSGTLDVSSGTFTTSTAQKQAIVQAGPGSGTLDVSSGTFTTSTAQKQAIVDGATIDSIPSGMIAPFGMSSAPTGWLVCDGSAVSRSTYSALFSAISTTWGTGDGSSTFNIPDLKGAYLRGVGTSTVFTQNQAITLAETLSDQFQAHEHSYTYWGFQLSTGYAAGRNYVLNDQSTMNATITTHNGALVSGSNGTPRTGNETRPNTRGVQYLINI